MLSPNMTQTVQHLLFIQCKTTPNDYYLKQNNLPMVSIKSCNNFNFFLTVINNNIIKVNKKSHYFCLIFKHCSIYILSI